MTVKELKEILNREGIEDFNIMLREVDFDSVGICLKDYNIEICDIGYSDKVIFLTKTEEVYKD